MPTSREALLQQAAAVPEEPQPKKRQRRRDSRKCTAVAVADFLSLFYVLLVLGGCWLPLFVVKGCVSDQRTTSQPAKHPIAIIPSPTAGQYHQGSVVVV